MDAAILSFVSGKGGTGKSTMALLVGAALQALGQKTLLIELSGSLRGLDLMAGVSERAVYDIEDVLSGRCAPGLAMVQSAPHGGLSLIPAPYSGGKIDPMEVFALCERLRAYFDYILLDAASGVGRAFRSAVAVAHRVVVVVPPDPAALRAGRFVADLAADRAGAVSLLLNLVDEGILHAAGALEDLDAAIDLVGTPLLGVVPLSTQIAAAAQSGRPLPAKSAEAQIFAAVAQRLLGRPTPLVFG